MSRSTRNRVRCHPAGSVGISGVLHRRAVPRVSGETWTIAGGGDNIWGTADEFHFAYRPISGDVDISARVSSFDTANEWSKAGVMIRDALTANARNAFALVSQAWAPRCSDAQPRAATPRARTVNRLPTWVRLVQTGQSIYRLPLGGRPCLDDDRDDDDQHARHRIRRLRRGEPGSRPSWQRPPSPSCKLGRACQRRGGIVMSEVRPGPAPRRPWGWQRSR